MLEKYDKIIEQLLHQIENGQVIKCKVWRNDGARNSSSEEITDNIASLSRAVKDLEIARRERMNE